MTNYNDQLKKLKKFYKDFSNKHTPTHDSNAISVNDPDVTQLLEGFAILTSELWTDVAKTGNDLYQIYSQHVLGNLIHSKPSATLLKFNPNDGFNSNAILKKGFTVYDDAPDNLRKQFTTVYDINIIPFNIEYTTVDQESSKHISKAEIKLKSTSVELNNINIKNLVFNLIGDYKNTTGFFYLLNSSIVDITIKGLEDNSKYVLNNDCYKSFGYEELGFLYNNNYLDFPEPHLLIEYFIFPEKLLAFSLDVEDIKEIFKNNSSILIEINFDIKKQNINITFDQVSLNNMININVVPAINLFRTTSIPVQVDNKDSKIQVTPILPNVNVYKITEVTGIKNNTRRVYSDFNDYTKYKNNDKKLTYFARYGHDQKHSSSCSVELAYGNDEYIILNETLICSLFCDNGNKADDINPGILNNFKSDANFTVSNLTKTSQYVNALSEKEQIYALLEKMNIDRYSMKNLENLQGFLENILLLSGKQQDNKARAKINAIIAFNIKETTKLKKNYMIYGQQISLTFKDYEKNFVNIGDLALFSNVLNHIFASLAPLNYFSQLVINSPEGDLILEMPTIIGDEYLF